MIYLGIDTSNYTTSAAIFDSTHGIVADERKLLPVKPGEVGLRQADAVFHHTAALHTMIENAFNKAGVRPDKIAVSTAPTDAQGSYMPCFTVGMGTAESIAAAMGIPCVYFSHQAGHITAAVYSSGKKELFSEEFIAFHVSGGTTEAVKITPDRNRVFTSELVAKSMDLKAGQAIDRVGKMLGLSFPSGRELDALALQSEKKYKIKPFMKDGNPSLSGLQNKCEQLLNKGEPPCDIAAYCIQYIISAVDLMTAELEKKYPGLPFVYSGGVMSNSLARKILPQRHNAVFSAPGFSSDNACGTAVLAYLQDNL